MVNHTWTVEARGVGTKSRDSTLDSNRLEKNPGRP